MSIFPVHPTVTVNQYGVLISLENPGSLDTMLPLGTSDYFKYWMHHIQGCRSLEDTVYANSGQRICGCGWRLEQGILERSSDGNIYLFCAHPTVQKISHMAI